MHKLQRPIAPTCLAGYRHGLNNWSDVSGEQRSEIWQQLDLMQHARCAYCECTIATSPGKRNAHIEHFRQKDAARYPQGTFEWRNLFGSCDRQESCGKYKDGLPVYPHQSLIKMDDEDPDTFFIFVSDGTIALRHGLTEPQQHRANETLRIFNLDADNGPLRQMRVSALQGYIQTAEEFAEFASNYELEEWLPLWEEELAAIADLPFVTAIKHTMMTIIQAE